MVNRKPDFALEKKLSHLYQNIAGVDEVGRGAIAGPIVAGAVIFKSFRKTGIIKEVVDSKLLTHEKRVILDKAIREKAICAIGVAEPEEIDKLGIGAANIVAFRRALDKLGGCDFALIDGRSFRGFDYKFSCHEKGESKSISIAAASIIAKVYRDNLMIELDKEYPNFNFANNKGYGCKKQYSALEGLGPCKIHRQSFLGKFYNNKNQLSLI